MLLTYRWHLWCSSAWVVRAHLCLLPHLLPALSWWLACHIFVAVMPLLELVSTSLFLESILFLKVFKRYDVINESKAEETYWYPKACKWKLRASIVKLRRLLRGRETDSREVCVALNLFMNSPFTCCWFLISGWPVPDRLFLVGTVRQRLLPRYYGYGWCLWHSWCFVFAMIIIAEEGVTASRGATPCSQLLTTQKIPDRVFTDGLLTFWRIAGFLLIRSRGSRSRSGRPSSLWWVSMVVPAFAVHTAAYSRFIRCNCW